VALSLLAVAFATSPPGVCAFASLHPRLLLRAQPVQPRSDACGRLPGDHPKSIDRSLGAANMGMRVKLQKQIKTEFGFQRWWDGEWRSMQTDNIKDPVAQFDDETLKMAKLMGVTPEELTKTMSKTAKVELDTSEYDNLLKACIKAAKAGDLSGMVQAREVLEKMEQVGIKPNVTTYNGVISACARAAGGKFRSCSVNDTETRVDLLERATTIINFAGGRMDTVEFSTKWREKYPNESLALWTHPAPNTTVPLSEIFRVSPRFQVQRGPLPHSPNVILVKRKDKSTATLKKKGASNTWVSVGLEYLEAMRKNNVQPNSETYNALIGMCARAAAEEAAFNVEAGSQSNTMVDKAWQLLGEMREKKLPVGLATYNALINVCAGAGLVDILQMSAEA
jgi:hypothetical protein